MLEDSENQINIDKQYAEGSVEVFPIVPEATARNQAATLALLGSNPNLEEEYKNNYLELIKGKTPPSYQGVEATIKSSYQKPLMNMLGDPNVELDVKKMAVSHVSNIQVEPHKEVSIKAASLDNPDANVHQAAIIEDTRKRMEEEFAYRDYEQKMINRSIASQDVNYKTVFTDMLEMAIPGSMTFGSARHIAHLAKEVGAETSISLVAGKDAIRARLASLPVEERMKVFSQIQKTLVDNPGIVFKDKNTVEAINTISEVAVTGNYNLGHKYIDAATQILDAIGVGGILRNGFKGLQKALTKVATRKVLDTPLPVSPLEITSAANPAYARDVYKAATQSDEAAKALAGTDRDSLIIRTEGPQPSMGPYAEATLINPVRELDKRIKELATQTGGIRYTDEEILAARVNTEKAFRDAAGVSSIDNYTQVAVEGDNLVVKGMFGSSESGFQTPEEAINQARFAFKNLAIPEKEFKLYQRTPENTYDLVDINAVKGVPGEYFIGLESKIPVSENLIPDEAMSPLTWKLNFFDRFPKLWSRTTGSLTQNLTDAASVQPKIVSSSAEVAVDRSIALEKVVLEKGDDFAKSAKRLPKDQQDNLLKVIVESDAQRTHFDYLTLKNKFNLSDESIDTLYKWRDAQDTTHWLSNLTQVKNLRNNLYKLFNNGNVQLFGKEVPKNGNLTSLYDPTTDTIKTLTRQEMDDLYNRGGTYAKLKVPEKINGVQVTHFIVENNPNSFLRVLNDSDQVLNYIPGYYKRYYKASRFVVRNERNADGTLYERAVAVAPSWEEADNYLKNAAKAEGKSPEEFGRVRADVRDGSELEFSAMSEAGFVNTRHRGQLLNNAQSPVYIGKQGMLLDPTESFTRAAAGVSQKVAMQDAIDTMKRRLYTQFKEVMPADGSYPMSPKDIGKVGDIHSPLARDARSLWQYIDSLEAGFRNSIDEFSKDMFKSLSISAGKKGMKGVEKVTGALSTVNPMNDLSGLIHRALITWNPLRQWIVQPSQALRLSFYDPVAFSRALKDWGTYINAIIKKNSKVALNANEKEIYDVATRWGALDGVDRSILVEGPLRDLSHSSNALLRGASKADKAISSVGFDFAERMNMFMHMATVRNRKMAKGLNVANLKVQDEIFSEARALTLSLNTAGQQPYNKTALSLFTKFLQIPHKSILQVTFNRRLDAATKAKLLAADTVLYGVPLAAVSNLIGADLIPDDPVLRDKIEFGMLTHMYNNLFQKAFDVNPDANLSGLAPYDVAGWKELFKGMMESGVAGAFAKTPVGTLTVGSNPRITNAMVKMFDFMRGNGAEGDPVKFPEVINEFAKIAGGYNNYIKYSYIKEAHRELSRTGVLLRDDVSNLAALHTLFGFSTTSEEKMFTTMNKVLSDTKDRQKEIRDGVKTAMANLRDKYYQGTDEFEQMMRIHQELNRVFQKPEDFKVAMDEYRKLMVDKETWMYGAMLKYAGFASTDDIKIAIKASAIPEEQKQKLIKIFAEDLKGLDEEIKKLDEKEK